MTAQEIIDCTLEGLMTEAEAADLLENLGIHGAFGESEFTGYDYINQCWVTN